MERAPQEAGFRSRWRRLLRHRWSDGSAQRVLGVDGARALEAAVARSEHGHRGEIRVCIEGGLPLSYLWRRASPRERATMLFAKLGVWDTERNNGVLIYLLLADRAIELVADRGVSQRVPAERWQRIVADLQEPLRQGRFAEGLAAAVSAVDALLCEQYPGAGATGVDAGGPGSSSASGADENELPNPPMLL